MPTAQNIVSIPLKNLQTRSGVFNLLNFIAKNKLKLYNNPNL